MTVTVSFHDSKKSSVASAEAAWSEASTSTRGRSTPSDTSTPSEVASSGSTPRATPSQQPQQPRWCDLVDGTLLNTCEDAAEQPDLATGTSPRRPRRRRRRGPGEAGTPTSYAAGEDLKEVFVSCARPPPPDARAGSKSSRSVVTLLDLGFDVGSGSKTAGACASTTLSAPPWQANTRTVPAPMSPMMSVPDVYQDNQMQYSPCYSPCRMVGGPMGIVGTSPVGVHKANEDASARAPPPAMMSPYGGGGMEAAGLMGTQPVTPGQCYWGAMPGLPDYEATAAMPAPRTHFAATAGSPAGTAEADTIRSLFAANGVTACEDKKDLKTQLQAAAPEIYLD